jgi:hypothetical protein
MEPMFSAFETVDGVLRNPVKTVWPDSTKVEALEDGEWVASEISFEEIMTDPSWVNNITEAEALALGAG